jgi:hypothetical protein
MIDNDVPLIAYIYVGISSLVLAYMTYRDESGTSINELKTAPPSSISVLPSFMSGESESKASSQTSILPSFMTGETNTSSTEPSVTQPENRPPIETVQQKDMMKLGGKKKKTKSNHKKTKNNKTKSNTKHSKK